MAVVSAAAALDPNASRRYAQKTLTLDGGAGTGATGAVPLFTVTGSVIINYIAGRCTTNLVSAGGGTLALGVTGQTSLFIAATTGTGILTTAELWVSTTPTAAGIALPAITKDMLINANIIGTVAVGAITAGVIIFDVVWEPHSSGATLV